MVDTLDTAGGSGQKVGFGDVKLVLAKMRGEEKQRK
jgi:hypothetical protein